MPQNKRKYSWIPTNKGRAQLSHNKMYVLLIGLDGGLYSLEVDRLLDLVAGHVESMRIFKLEDHS